MRRAGAEPCLARGFAGSLAAPGERRAGVGAGGSVWLRLVMGDLRGKGRGWLGSVEGRGVVAAATAGDGGCYYCYYCYCYF